MDRLGSNLSGRLVLAGVLSAALTGRAGPIPPVDFDAQVAPILADRCLVCHNPSDRKGGLDLSEPRSATKGGKSGAAVVPGQPQRSLLWQRVAKNEMPPDDPLTAAEKQVLFGWISQGARWTRRSIELARERPRGRAGEDWWSLAPLVPPEPPRGSGGSWAQNPIDRFIFARIEAEGLTPSEPADRRTLIRRLSFDLLGLPPTPEEVSRFVSDRSADAYDRLVRDLLESPHYGERWARHWLDVVRFGQSQGFERDKLRPNAWRYRDWLIQAINDDMPYDQFVRLQLAGDVLHPNDPAGIAATGFLVAGPFDEVGQQQQSALMRAVVRQEELEDIVGTTAQTFLGLSVHCARCHDHKFDPIAQKDYYRLAASLGGVRQGEREVAGSPDRDDQARTERERRIDELSRQIAEIDEPVRTRLEHQLAATRIEVPSPIARWEFDEDGRDAVGELNAVLHGNARIDGGRLHLDGKDAYASTPPLPRRLLAKTFEVWVQLENLSQRGGGVIGVQTLDGKTFDGIVLGEKEPGRWMAGSDHFARTQGFGGPPEEDAASRPVHLVWVYHMDYTIAAYRDGVLYGQPYAASGLPVYPAGKAQVIFGIRHWPAGAGKMLAGSIERAQIYDRALTAEQVQSLSGRRMIPEDSILTELAPQERVRRDRLILELSSLQARQHLRMRGTIHAVVPQSPEPAYVLVRGNPANQGEPVGPGSIQAVGKEAAFELPPDADDVQRRTALARWITDPANPLAGRVMVNRLWHHHFGRGLVETPNDLGFNGRQPSHPELLDWLAAELVRRNWSAKDLHRLIVTSATYRQSSAPREAAARIDSENRWLWRKSPMRLDAETIRDAMLAVAGELNPRMGGPGYGDFVTRVNNSQFYDPIDPVGYEFQRRTIYRMWIRSGRSGFLDCFDCPDPSTTTPVRAVTTTPLQALSLLNDSFVLRTAQSFARRVVQEVGEDTGAQARRAFERALARPPQAEELAEARQFVADHGLAAYCRVLFNCHEFLYVD